jgi:hypothetical protein
MKITGKMIVILSAVVFCTSGLSYAGKLDDFEKDSTKKKQSDKAKETSICGEIIGGILGAIIGVFVAEGVHEIAKGSNDGNKSGAGNKETDKENNDKNPADHAGDESPPLKERGSPLMPYARIDASYQHLSSNLKAQDYFAEFGYKPVAVSGRFTRYMESDPDDTMDAAEIFLLYRMKFKDMVEIDLGVGDMIIKGEATHSGMSLTAPVRFKPVDYAWLEFRPAIADINGNFMQDYDLSAHVGWRYASVKAGYRWFMSPDETLDGPYLGISLYY